MRCLYCHNPDSWSTLPNLKMSVDEIMQKYDGVKEFVKSGGITVTGGEPLLQIEFVTELFKTAKEKNIPVVLDPVGVMSSTLRLDFALELLRSKSITAVRCNQAEAQALLDERGGGRGLDAAGGDDPKCMRLAQELARKYNITVAITGATDYVSDGKRALALQGGNPLLKRITGSGCMTTTLVACCCAVGTDMLVATALALVIMGQAAEVAAGLLEAKDGPGMFRARLSDCVYHVVTKWDAINSALSADKIQ